MKKCPECGSKKTTKAGFKTFKGGIKEQRYKCNDCGHVFRESKKKKEE